MRPVSFIREWTSDGRAGNSEFRARQSRHGRLRLLRGARGSSFIEDEPVSFGNDIDPTRGAGEARRTGQKTDWTRQALAPLPQVRREIVCVPPGAYVTQEYEYDGNFCELMWDTGIHACMCLCGRHEERKVFASGKPRCVVNQQPAALSISATRTVTRITANKLACQSDCAGGVHCARTKDNMRPMLRAQRGGGGMLGTGPPTHLQAPARARSIPSSRRRVPGPCPEG
ncbi:hypothetical protein C8T65DRAFT_294295 [Cerioporus squamosus]|nr:hypothetical protein C8T65DRAFT_294295 [Cerioporus squamosus]